jgi:hypothetical protein
MAPFRFSLQALLDRRANLEAEQRRALLAAEGVAARENAKLATLAARLQQSSRSFGDACAETASGDVRALLLEIELVKTRSPGSSTQPMRHLGRPPACVKRS